MCLSNMNKFGILSQIPLGVTKKGHTPFAVVLIECNCTAAKRHPDLVNKYRSCLGAIPFAASYT